MNRRCTWGSDALGALDDSASPWPRTALGGVAARSWPPARKILRGALNDERPMLIGDVVSGNRADALQMPALVLDEMGAHKRRFETLEKLAAQAVVFARHVSAKVNAEREP